MATITKTVGTASRNYSTLAAAYASVPANLVTDGNSYVLDCYNDSEFMSASTLLAISGNTTDSTHTLTIKAATNNSFSDNASAQTNRLSYVAANGVGIRCTGAYTYAMTNIVDYVYMSGLQATMTNGSAYQTYRSVATTPNNKVSNCIFESAALAPVRIRSALVTNSVFVQRASGSGDGVQCDYPGTLTYVNCTVVRPSDKTAAGNGFTADSATVTVKNCAIYGFTNSVNNSARFTGSNNSSDTTIGFGTSNQASKTYASQFSVATNATSDFKLKTGADCIDTGVTDTTDIPSATDAVGTSRPQGSAWDIGAWELIVGAGSSKLFMTSQLNGIGSGGPFFNNQLG